MFSVFMIDILVFPNTRLSNTKKGYRFHHTGPQIDIVPIWGKPRMLGGKMLLQTFIRHKTALFPVKHMCFESMLLPVPQNSSYVLTAIYGPDYMKVPDIQSQTESFRYGMTCRAHHYCPKSRWTLDYFSDFNANGEMVKEHPRADPWLCYYNRWKKKMICKYKGEKIPT
eukprot:PhF_6_TR42879/c0_g1_i1/m.64964